MTQVSTIQADHISNFPTSDAGPYSADQWSEMFRVLFTGDQQATQGPLARYLNELAVTINVVGPPPVIRVDTGAGFTNGHWFNSDAVAPSPTDFTIPLPVADPRIDRVVIAENNTNLAYTVSDLGFVLDFPDDVTDYNGTNSIEPYSARLVIMQGAENAAPATPGLDQNANHYMVELYRYQISAAGAITNNVDYRDFCEFSSPAWFLEGNTGTIPGTHFLGTTDAQDLEIHVNALRALLVEVTAGTPNLISGHPDNVAGAGAVGATIGGGGSAAPSNHIIGAADNFGTIGGGEENEITANYGTIAGGIENEAASYAAIGGGATNIASGDYSTIAGGTANQATARESTVGGGGGNQATAIHTTVGGGDDNTATVVFATVSGGSSNNATGSGSTIGGGDSNNASGEYSAIGGGDSNGVTGDYGAVAGGQGNVILAAGDYGGIPGGRQAQVDRYGQIASASGQFAAAGDAQGTIQMVARRTVTHSDANWYELFLDGAGAAQRMTIAADTVWTFDALIVGTTQGCTKSFSFRIEGAVENDGGTTTILASTVTTIYDADDVSFDARASADDPNDALLIEVTDADSTGDVVRWVTTLRTAEVTWPA